MLNDAATPPPNSYFRFVVTWHKGSKKHQLGIMRSAGRLRDTQQTTYDDEQALRAVARWFHRNLAAPARLNKVAAIFWFKPHVAGETEMWANLTEMVRLLQKYHYNVEIVSTTRPGKIVYDDDFQIAAIPFNDTFEIGTAAPVEPRT